MAPTSVDPQSADTNTADTNTADTNTVSSSVARPRRGRPRSAEADTAILAATLELAGEVGIKAMSMDELACRAGVSKATIYRRWPNKEALVIDALRKAMRPFDDVDSGEIRSDLVIYLTELARRKNGGKMANVLPHLIEASSHDPALADSLDAYVQHRRTPLRLIFERAVERDELPTDTDIELLIDVTIGPFVYRHLLTRQPLDAHFVDRLLAVILPKPPS